jgi:alkylation response protein AidB-like acyl-CoA dehydrogenase
MIDWTEEQSSLRAAMEDLGGALSEGAAERDRAEEFPVAAWGKLAGSDLFRLPIEERHGGLGLDLLTTMYVLEGLGFTCRDAGLGFAASTQIVSVGVPLQKFGSEELKARFLPVIGDGSVITAHAITEPGGGSDAMAMATTARRDGDDFVLDGSKTFVTSGPVADLFTVYARTGGSAGITAFLVERGRPGFAIGAKISKMGLRTSPFCTLYFDGCRVPAGRVIGPVGSGFWVFDHVMKWEILCSFAVTAGEMRHRLTWTVGQVTDRGSGRHQAVAHRVVDMKVALETARLWLYHTAERLQRGRNVTVDVAISKLLASQANLDTALSAVHVLGGYGYTTEYGVERELRDAVAGPIYSGTTETQKNRIAAMLGL